jgi:hypothetical protein
LSAANPYRSSRALGINKINILRFAGLGLIFNIAGAQLALAAKWRFCIAPSSQEYRVYMTKPFLAGVSMEELEDRFHQLLYSLGLRHDSVQCPTGANEEAVRAMRQYASEFNRQKGTEVVQIDWKSATTR